MSRATPSASPAKGGGFNPQGQVAVPLTFKAVGGLRWTKPVAANAPSTSTPQAGAGAVAEKPAITQPPGAASGTVGGANGGVAAGELSGTRTVIPPLSDAATTRSLIRENESASILANNGYKVEQNPQVPGSKNPDYRVNGEIFDNYAPSTSSVRNAWSEMDKKVARGQADHVVVNLADSSITPAALREQLTNYPIAGLKQVIVIDKSGAPIVIKFEGR